MRHLFLLAILCVFQRVYSQSSYYKDVIVDRITVNYLDHTVTAFVKPPKGSVFARQNKNYFWYNANTIQVTQGGFSGKLLNGLYTAHYGNKNLKEQGVFKNGLKTGEWKAWNKEGKLNEIIKWNSGLMDGRFYRYDDNGNLKEKGRYSNGLLSGKVINYSVKDSATIIHYREGKQVIRIKKKMLPGFIKKLYEKEKSEKK